MAEQIWKMRKDETAYNYKAALTYFEMEPRKRTLNAVAVKLKTGKRIIQGLSYQFDWVNRAKAYDQHRQNFASETAEAAIRKTAEEHAQLWAQRRTELREQWYEIGTQLITRAKEMMKFPLQRVERKEEEQTVIIHPYRWTGNTINETLKTGAALHQLASGLAANADPLDDLDFDTLSSDDLTAIQANKPIEKRGRRK